MLEFCRCGAESAPSRVQPSPRAIIPPPETPTLCTSTLSRLQVAEFADLAPEWDALVDASARPNFFSTYRWQTTWWECLAGDARLHLLALRDGPDPVVTGVPAPLLGIVPLMADGDRLALVGGSEVCDFLDLIARPGCEERVVDAMLDEVGRDDCARLVLHGVPAASPTRALLPRLAAARGWTIEDVVEDVSPAVALPGDFESYLATLSKKDRHELRRKLRRLFAAGDVRWFAVEPGAATAADVDDFLRLHRLNDDKSGFMTATMERFFRVIVERFQPTGELRLYFLEVDGKRVSTIILFDYRDEYWLYNSGFDPAYHHLSVGLLLKALVLGEAIERGRRTFDFLQGAEPYKYDLGGIDRTVHRLTLIK